MHKNIKRTCATWIGIITETLIRSLQVHQLPLHVPAYIFKIAKQKLIDLKSRIACLIRVKGDNPGQLVCNFFFNS
jgi:hypothetical protein